MVGNLAKSPLAAIFFGALFWFVAAGPLPYSQAYREATAAFILPLAGYLYLIVFALWTTVLFALVFSNTRARGVRLILPATAASWGLQWGIPLLQQLIHGESTGAVAKTDTLLWLASGCVCTALLLALLLFLYKLPERPSLPAGKAPPPPAKYRIKVLGLIIRMLLLPVIFMVMYYLLWYFLLWRSDTVREFYGGAEKLGFMAEIIRILIERGFEVVVVLIKGLAYAAFSLPLLFLLSEKRGIFLIANVMFYLSGALFYLIPSPFMPQAVRLPHFIEGAALCAAYGVAAGFLLHTSLKRENAPAAAKAAPQPDAKAKDPAPATTKK